MKKFLALLLILGLLASPAKADTSFSAFLTNANYIAQGTGSEFIAAVIGGVTKYFTAIGLAHFGQVVVTQAPYNASGFLASTVTSGSVTSGTFNIPVTSSANFYVGHIGVVSLAGTGGLKNFCGFISAIPDSTHITFSATAVTGSALLPTCTSGTGGTQATIPANYIVWEVGNTTMTGSAANGATSVTVSNATTYSINQGISIALGVSSTVDLVAKITGISSNTITFTPAITNSSGVASGSVVRHDDTAAFQAAFNVVSYVSNVNIFVPDGWYNINGQPDSNGNAISLPSILYYPGCCSSASIIWDAQSVVKISGALPAAEEQAYIATSQIAPVIGAILHTDNSGATYNIFGGTNTSGSLNGMTNIQFIMDNLLFRTYPNPWVNLASGQYIQGFSSHGVSVDTGETGATTQPTHTGQIAIADSAGQDGGNNEFRNMEFYGQYGGLYVKEHTMVENIRFDADVQPMLMGGDGNSLYAIFGRNIQCNGSVHCIITSGSQQQNIDMQGLNIEHTSTPSWTTSVDDINDTNNILFGQITVDSPLVGNNQNVYHAYNVNIVNMHSPSYPIENLTGNLLATGFPNGKVVMCTDCTIAATCAQGGTGALAKHLNGVWVCN